MKRPDGVIVIAAYEFICGFLSLCVGNICLWLAAIFAVTSSSPWFDFFFWGGIGLLLTTMGALTIAVGIGLLRMRQWARWVAAALAVLSLPVFPFGTVIGVLILWYLLRDSVDQQFQRGIL